MSEQETTENNEIIETTTEETTEQETTQEETVEKSEREKELEQENAKYRRLLNKKDKTEDVKQEKETKGLDPRDIKALMDVDEEDWDELREYAEFKKISIADAKKTSAMKAILDENAEFRKTEQAKNTSRTKQTESVTADSVLKDLKAGKVPKAGSKEAEELYWARRGGRRG